MRSVLKYVRKAFYHFIILSSDHFCHFSLLSHFFSVLLQPNQPTFISMRFSMTAATQTLALNAGMCSNGNCPKDTKSKIKDYDKCLASTNNNNHRVLV